MPQTSRPGGEHAASLAEASSHLCVTGTQPASDCLPRSTGFALDQIAQRVLQALKGCQPRSGSSGRGCAPRSEDSVLQRREACHEFWVPIPKNNSCPVPGVLLDLSRVHLTEHSVDDLWQFLLGALGRSPNNIEPHNVPTTPQRITALSVSHNSLGDFGVLRLFTHLFRHHGSRSILPEYGLKCPSMMAISSIELFGVGLTDDALPLLIAEAKQHNVVLSKLKLGDNRITAIGMRCLCKALSGPLSSLRQLHIGGNPIGAEGVAALAHAWSYAPHTLESLGLRGLMSTSPEQFCIHANADFHHHRLPMATALEQLLFTLGSTSRRVSSAGDTAGEVGGPATGLIELQLRGTPLTANAVCGLAQGFVAKGSSLAITTCPFFLLETLDLASCNLNDHGASELLSAISVAVSDCEPMIEDDGRPQWLRLRELFLQDNSIGRSSCGYLGAILSAGGGVEGRYRWGWGSVVRCPLATLDISCNGLASADLAHFFTIWAEGYGSCCLNSLIVSHNHVRMDAVRALVRIFELQSLLSCTVEQPNTSHTNVPSVLTNGSLESTKCFPATTSYWPDRPFDAILSCRRVILTALTLHGCQMGTAPAIYLFDGLARFPGRFRVLDMPHNNFGDDAVPALCAMLSTNRVLSKLSIQDNNIRHEESMKILVSALEENGIIRSVSAGGQSTIANVMTTDLRQRVALAASRNKAAWMAEGRRRATAHGVTYENTPLGETPSVPLPGEHLFVQKFSSPWELPCFRMSATL